MGGQILEDHSLGRIDLEEQENLGQEPLNRRLDVESQQSEGEQKADDDEDNDLRE